jgi:hypothetical protein
VAQDDRQSKRQPRARKRPPKPPIPYQEIPYNDPGWIPVREFVDVGVPRLRSLDIAFSDVYRGIESGDVPSLMRFSDPPDEDNFAIRIPPREARLISLERHFAMRVPPGEARLISLERHYYGRRVRTRTNFGDARLYLHRIGLDLIWPTGGFRLVAEPSAEAPATEAPAAEAPAAEAPAAEVRPVMPPPPPAPTGATPTDLDLNSKPAVRAAVDGMSKLYLPLGIPPKSKSHKTVATELATINVKVSPGTVRRARLILRSPPKT